MDLCMVAEILDARSAPNSVTGGWHPPIKFLPHDLRSYQDPPEKKKFTKFVPIPSQRRPTITKMAANKESSPSIRKRQHDAISEEEHRGEPAVVTQPHNHGVEGHGKPRGAKRLSKKQRRIQEYHSSDESDEGEGLERLEVNITPIDLALSDDEEDIHGAAVDDGESSSSGESSSGSSEEREGARKRRARERYTKLAEADGTNNDDQPSSSYASSDDESASGGGSSTPGSMRKPKAHRHDPSHFSASMSRILSAKLSTASRADPVLARSAAAADASRTAADAVLESAARRKMRAEKKLALEKGRVRDVLVPSGETLAVGPGTGLEAVSASIPVSGAPTTTTTELLATERRLRKTAQRGVVRLFNAVRQAQERAAEAEKGVRKEGVLGMGKREDKVLEVSRQGFLDLINRPGGSRGSKADVS